MNCRRLPGRLNTTEAAVILGFQEHDIPVLIAGKCLSPLGKPAQNAPKYFASVEICALAQDRDRLDRATRVLTKFWLDKNSRYPGDRFEDIERKDQKSRGNPVSVQRSRQSPGESANRERESEAGLS